MPNLCGDRLANLEFRTKLPRAYEHDFVLVNNKKSIGVDALYQPLISAETEVYVEPLIYGMRVFIYNDKIFAESGFEIPATKFSEEIRQKLSELPKDYVFDSIITYFRGGHYDDTYAAQFGVGEISNYLCGGSKKKITTGDFHGIVLRDMIHIDDFTSGISHATYDERRALMYSSLRASMMKNVSKTGGKYTPVGDKHPFNLFCDYYNKCGPVCIVPSDCVNYQPKNVLNKPSVFFQDTTLFRKTMTVTTAAVVIRKGGVGSEYFSKAKSPVPSLIYSRGRMGAEHANAKRFISMRVVGLIESDSGKRLLKCVTNLEGLTSEAPRAYNQDDKNLYAYCRMSVRHYDTLAKMDTEKTLAGMVIDVPLIDYEKNTTTGRSVVVNGNYRSLDKEAFMDIEGVNYRTILLKNLAIRYDLQEPNKQ